MQKIVVGIIAVFFVQVGFQIYSAVSRTNYAYTSATIDPLFTPGSLDRSAVPPYLGNLYRSSLPSEKAETPRPRSEEPIEYQARSPYQPVQAVKRGSRRPEVLRSAAIGPDIVITIAPPVRPAYSPTNAIVSSSVKREKKRSFLSKSLHVLKKPYDWLKAVAMKLD